MANLNNIYTSQTAYTPCVHSSSQLTSNTTSSLATAISTIQTLHEQKETNCKVMAKVAVATESTRGLCILPIEIINIIIDYTENETEIYGILKVSKYIPEKFDMIELASKIQKVDRKYSELTFIERKILALYGKYKYSLNFDDIQSPPQKQLLQSFPNLRALSLRCYKFPKLPPLPLTLQSVDLSNSETITDESIQPLSRCTNLEFVNLSHSLIQKLPPFSEKLKTLLLGWCFNITDASLESLSKNTQLETIDLTATKITKIPILSESLVCILLGACTQIPANEFKTLLRYTVLKKIELTRTEIPSLSFLPQSLESILISLTHIDNNELTNIARFTKLKQIYFNMSIISILRYLPITIEDITISKDSITFPYDDPTFPSWAIQVIEKLPALKCIHLNCVKINTIPNFSNTLEKLTINGTPISSKCIKEFQRTHPNVEVIWSPPNNGNLIGIRRNPRYLNRLKKF